MDQAELLKTIKKAAQTKQPYLNLSGKKLTLLPPEIGQLINLTELFLDNNQLSNLPTEIGQLTNLTVLYLHNNQLSNLPTKISQLINLTELFLDNNQLSNLPTEIGQLTNLTVLYLHNNQLSNLPTEIGQLTNLTVLYLHNNQLSNLPTKISQLINLTELFLDNNQLSNLPTEIGQLTNLTMLYLRNNQLNSLPVEVSQLINLAGLFLDNNQLNSLPVEIGQLTNLTGLFLDNNQLNSLPVEIGQLTNLTALYFRNNQLSNLPAEVSQLINLTALSFSNNPLISPHRAVVEQGTAAVLTYLREQLDAGTKQWISKLLVVGEGGVGKTSLLRALNGQPFDEQELTTHGIEISSLNLAHPTEADVTMQLNTWDFGGQEIYHATHQFFLTNRSLFLLAWNARLGWEQGKLIYWLKTIRANAPDSPIILVAAHIDERDANLPLSELQEQFPQVVGQWEISNKTNQGIEDLRRAITNAAAELPLMGEPWPTTWLKFAEAVRASRMRYVSPQRFWQIMTQCKVKPSSQRILATWLHELGDILFFQDNDDLNDIVILKPQWVTEYISKVLEAEEVIQRNGIFTRTCMEQLWHDLDAPMRDHFLRLMERFDLSYRTLENKDISLVVERLPFEPPDYEPLWDAKQQESNCKEISMKFQLSEMLPGIPTWFIARQHRFTIEVGDRRGIHWRTGVLFQDREQKHLALTKVGRDDRTNAEYLQLTVRGPMPHSFFDLLKEGIELTLRRYPGLQITRLIPCPDPNREHCLHEFDYANLVKRLERTPPKEEIECPNCLENISAAKLLFGLHWTTQDAVLARLDRMQEGQSELRELVQSQFLRQFRQQQKYLESYCPNVFVLRPDDRKPWQKDIGLQRINLQLYCQMPGCMHPTIDSDAPKKPCGLYAIDEPQWWLHAIAPYYRRMVGVLKFATPLVGPWLGIMDAKDYQDIFKSDIDLAKELANKLPNSKGFSDLDYAEVLPGSERQLEHLDGSALRALRQLLDRKDANQHWGGLKRLLTPEGDYLWLCSHHAREFNP